MKHLTELSYERVMALAEIGEIVVAAVRESGLLRAKPRRARRAKPEPENATPPRPRRRPKTNSAPAPEPSTPRVNPRLGSTARPRMPFPEEEL